MVIKVHLIFIDNLIIIIGNLVIENYSLFVISSLVMDILVIMNNVVIAMNIFMATNTLNIVIVVNFIKHRCFFKAIISAFITVNFIVDGKFNVIKVIEPKPVFIIVSFVSAIIYKNQAIFIVPVQLLFTLTLSVLLSVSFITVVIIKAVDNDLH